MPGGPRFVRRSLPPSTQSFARPACPRWTSRGNESEGERRRQAERDGREVVLGGQSDEMRQERDRGKRGCRKRDRSRGAGRTARRQKDWDEHDERQPERIENQQI